MKKVFTSENVVGFVVACAASLVVTVVVFRLLPATWRAKIVGA